MFYVYRIRSRHHPKETFLGVTRNIKKRLALHNSGQVKATREYSPWRVSFYAAFSRKSRAEAFYDYLSSPAGKEFGEKPLWQQGEDPDEP
jgi:hypothetical protein